MPELNANTFVARVGTGFSRRRDFPKPGRGCDDRMAWEGVREDQGLRQTLGGDEAGKSSLAEDLALPA